MPLTPEPRRLLRPRPEFNQLEMFLEVARARSFSGAARSTGRTQPAVSRAIGRLENLCGGDLFQRRPGAPLILTPVGEAILPTARLLLHTVDQMLLRATQTAQSRAGTLKLGVNTGLVSGPLRAALADFTRACPDVQLRLIEGIQSELHRQLMDGGIDLMIAALMTDLASTALTQEALWEERLVVALPEDHPLAARTALDWGDVASLRVILWTSPGGFTGGGVLHEVGGRAIVCEQHAVSRSTLLEMVVMGFGATIAFESAVTPCVGVTYRPIEDENAVTAIGAVWPTSDGNPLRHRLLADIRRCAASRTMSARAVCHRQRPPFSPSASPTAHETVQWAARPAPGPGRSRLEALD